MKALACFYKSILTFIPCLKQSVTVEQARLAALRSSEDSPVRTHNGYVRILDICATESSFYISSGDLNSRCQACMASTFTH